jgi:hypothetical protein
MKKTDLLIGIMIGIVSAVIGTYIFIEGFTGYSFFVGIREMKLQGHLGKVITLGAILNLIIFFVLLQINKEMMARGVVLATIILTVVTLFT